MSRSQPKIYVTRKIFDEAIEILKSEGGAHVDVYPGEDDAIPRNLLKQKLAEGNYNAIIPMLTDKIDREILDIAGDQLKIVSNFAVGYNNISVSDATEKGVMVTNTPDVLNDSTADCAFMLMMAVARRLVETDKIVREGKWEKPWGPKMFLGSDITGKTLGILGMGRIGVEMVPRAKGFKMKVLYNKHNRYDTEKEEALGVEYRDMDDLLRESDFISLHVPLTEETTHLIGERELQLMKPTAFLINTARGPVIDETALYKALSENWIAGAGLDVHDVEPTIPQTNPLLSLDNIVVAPHIGSATVDTRLAMAMRAATNVVAFLKGKQPPDLVNPEAVADSTK
eukprot:CAMPEP_0195302150 /NCGR_PEP_ID=MMETSP0707-20130614/30578_1 /TAXON_ID=33640 /ORGANISM="Asterionellopsis glacialis, Strain CCMP134" /LENGTH=340 /DNA_ID=CAMNT_0040365321 /DNA_START=160 /DNA_END=1182 /DNA_ORIENTATION=+